MKLSDLQADLDSLRKQLEAKYNTDVATKLTLNPEDVGVVIMTIGLRTTQKPVVVEETAPAAEVKEETPTKRTRKSKAKAESTGGEAKS